jgi:Ca2+-binding RTX toxin-like protein
MFTRRPPNRPVINFFSPLRTAGLLGAVIGIWAGVNACGTSNQSAYFSTSFSAADVQPVINTTGSENESGNNIPSKSPSHVIRGTNGNDQISGDNGDDLLEGSKGNDTLSGGMGNDRLLGGEGDDKPNSGQGNDTLEGGPGADQFIFTLDAVGKGIDEIRDFRPEEGDKIVLLGIHPERASVSNDSKIILSQVRVSAGMLRVHLKDSDVWINVAKLRRSDISIDFLLNHKAILVYGAF